MPRIFLQNAILLPKGRFLPLGPSQEGHAGTHDRGIFWIRRDLQGPAGTWTRVTLAMTHGNGDPRCVFLEKGTPERRDGGILWENGARK